MGGFSPQVPATTRLNWRTSSGPKILGSWKCAREVDAVALTPSGHRIAYASGRLVVRRKNGELVRRIASCGADRGCLALSKDGSRIVFASGGEVSAVDLRTAARLGPFRRLFQTRGYPVCGLPVHGACAVVPPVSERR